MIPQKDDLANACLHWLGAYNGDQTAKGPRAIRFAMFRAALELLGAERARDLPLLRLKDLTDALKITPDCMDDVEAKCAAPEQWMIFVSENAQHTAILIHEGPVPDSLRDVISFATTGQLVCMEPRIVFGSLSEARAEAVKNLPSTQDLTIKVVTKKEFA